MISYNYSDVLSRNVNRGNKGTIERGQAKGMYKYGYVINDEKYHEPDEKYFEVRKEAFKRKVYENQTDEMIRRYIVSSGFRRKYKNADRESLPNKKGLYKVRLDPFYYGILIS